MRAKFNPKLPLLVSVLVKYNIFCKHVFDVCKLKFLSNQGLEQKLEGTYYQWMILKTFASLAARRWKRCLKWVFLWKFSRPRPWYGLNLHFAFHCGRDLHHLTNRYQPNEEEIEKWCGGITNSSFFLSLQQLLDKEWMLWKTTVTLEF